MDDVDLEVHLARHGSARTPLPGAPLSTKYGQQSTEGGARGGRLSVDGACNQEPDGYRGTRHKIYTDSAAVLA